MKMKRTVSSALVAVLSLGCGGLAQAVPISFAFSGVVDVTDPDGIPWAGQRAGAELLIETDGLHARVVGGQVPNATFDDRLDPVTRPIPILGSVSIGGEFLSLDGFPNGFGGVFFNDNCAPPVCGGFAREIWTIQLHAQTAPFGSPPDGVFTYRDLFFTNALAFDFANPQATTDYFDVATVAPIDILTLPPLQMTGLYGESTVSCLAGACTTLSTRRAQFTVDSLVRSSGDTVPVPEPGTLGLLAFGLAGIFARRRRQPRVVPGRD
jgi:hypothetical protein